MHQQPVPLPDGALAVPAPPHDLPRPAQQRAVQRQARRQALHQQVWALHRQGWTAPAIAQQVGPSACARSSAISGPPPFRGADVVVTAGKASSLPISPIALSAGMRRAIPPCGCFATFASAAMLAAMVWSRPMRVVYARPKAYLPGTAARGQPLPAVAEPSCPPLTPRRATRLVLRHEAKRTEAETQQLVQLREQQAEVAEAIDLAQDFATLVRQRQPMQLDPWLKRATTSTLEALRRFATGLSEDYAAV